MCYNLWYNALTMLPAGNIVGALYHKLLAYSLVLLKMGKMIARNMLSRLELLINRYFCIYLVVYIIYINDARLKKYQVSHVIVIFDLIVSSLQ